MFSRGGSAHIWRQSSARQHRRGGARQRAATSSPPSQTEPASSVENSWLAQYHSGKNGVGATRMFVCVFMCISTCTHSCMYLSMHVFISAGNSPGRVQYHVLISYLQGELSNPETVPGADRIGCCKQRPQNARLKQESISFLSHEQGWYNGSKVSGTQAASVLHQPPLQCGPPPDRQGWLSFSPPPATALQPVGKGKPREQRLIRAPFRG